MTTEQIHEAMGQMISHCKELEANDYHSVSARGVLYTLGYAHDEADEVLTALHDGGFDYCIDPMFPCRSTCDGPNAKPEPTPSHACYWGPDQLRSRIVWVAPAKYR